jgi:hypothetical protein
MRTAARILGAAALLTAGLAVAGPAPAYANDPAPTCETGASRFFCTADNGRLVSNWTIHRTWGNSTVTVPGTSTSLNSTCQANTSVQVFYTYVDPSDGLTKNSGTDQFLCNPGDWP